MNNTTTLRTSDVFETLKDFDAEGNAPASPVGTTIRHGRERRRCVLFDTLAPGTVFFPEPRTNESLTRSERPVERCNPRWRGAPVWIND